jgi:flagellin-like hook-associated protein FlgL
MPIESLNRVISPAFFSRVVSLTQSRQDSTAALKAAFSGSGSSGVSLSESLNVGARLYTSSARSLNQAVSTVQIVKNSLEKLSDLSGRLVSILDEASSPSLSTQERKRLDSEYREIGREFQNIIDETVIGDNEIFKSEGLTDILSVVGLSPDESETIGAIYDDLVLSERDDESKFASDEIRGDRPVGRPRVSDDILAYSSVRIGQVREQESIFDDDRSLRVLSDVAVLKKDVAALDSQIKGNLKTMEVLEDTLIANYGLARAVAIAMSDLQDDIKSSTEAEELAKMLREEIRKNSNTAMRAQAGNLDSLAVAAYALSLEGD